MTTKNLNKFNENLIQNLFNDLLRRGFYDDLLRRGLNQQLNQETVNSNNAALGLTNSTFYPTGVQQLPTERTEPMKTVTEPVNNSERMKVIEETLRQQNEELQRMAEETLVVGTVVDVRDKFVYVSQGGNNIQRVTNSNKWKFKSGQSVVINPESGNIVEVIKGHIAFGKVCSVKTVNEENNTSEIDLDGQIQLVYNGEQRPVKGDRVVLDKSDNVIIMNLGKTSDTFTPDSVPDTTWNDIGGLVEAKALMREAVETPHTHKELFTFYNKKPTKGVLLYGPPGCGKTLLAKAAANSLSKIYNKKEARASAFIYIKGPEILNKYVGESEATVRSLFTRAKAHKDEFGYPAVIFIDEADALLMARGTDNTSHMSNTVVPMFLAEMDGLDDSGALIILATNRPDTLDPAITRDGRIDRKVKVTRPTLESAKDIILMNLKHVPIHKNNSHEVLAQAACDAMFDKDRVLYKIKTKKNGVQYLRLSDTLNGGMLAGLVDYAVSLAIRRDMEVKKPNGVTMQDLLEAVDHIDFQSRDLNHKGEIDDFVLNLKDEAVKVFKTPIGYIAELREKQQDATARAA